jgi:fluoride ion exporter CrcB/FEX
MICREREMGVGWGGVASLTRYTLIHMWILVSPFSKNKNYDATVCNISGSCTCTTFTYYAQTRRTNARSDKWP